MKRLDGGLVVALVGVFAVIVGWTDVINRYLKPSMSFWLVLSGAVLTVLGTALLATGWWEHRRAGGEDEPEPDPGDGHGDGRRFSRVGWLLVVPLVFAVVVNPGALGSYAVGRQSSTRDLPPADFDLGEHLRTHTFGGQAAELALSQVTLAANDAEQVDLLADTRIAVEGFVVNEVRPPRMLLSRILVSCCAGDGLALTVELGGVDGLRIADDQWVRVEGSLDLEATEAARAVDEFAAPVFAAETVEEIDPPSEPYLYPL